MRERESEKERGNVIRNKRKKEEGMKEANNVKNVANLYVFV